MPEVRSVEYVSKEEALRRYREERAAQGQQDLTLVPAREPAAGEPRGQAPQAGGLPRPSPTSSSAEAIVDKVQNIEDTTDRLV